MLSTLDIRTVIYLKARYWSKIAIFAPVRGPRRNIAITFALGKLERYGCPTVRKIGRFVHLFWQNTWMWQTDR